MTSKEEDIQHGLENEKKTERTTLAGVISKIKEIGQDQYNGQVFDNVYGIFTQLSVSERRLLLKGLINICFIVENEVLTNGSSSLREVKSVIEDTATAVHVGMNDIEAYNRVELIKMKNMVTRIVGISLAVAIAISVIAVVVLSANPLGSFEILGDTFKIAAEIFGI